MNQPVPKHVTSAMLLCLLAACGGSDDDVIPQLAPATGASLGSCDDLPTRFSFANTTITAANAIAAGTLTIAGTPVGAHCQVTGTMYPRTSTVDSKTYAIGFEMRLPNTWNGRFFYQANGGIDGSVVPATGANSGGGPLTNALQQGFAVISSDAGHNGSQNPTFGIDPQARLDYGYQAVGKLTPMAKNLISTAYGKAPDRSYIGGCSNGGRHTMVAAARYADQYDGFLVGDPGFRLPLAAVANIAAYQGYATVATNPADPSTGYTAPERTRRRRGGREVRCARWCGRRTGPGYEGVPSGVRPESRRSHLHRRARRHLPVGAAENRYRQALFGRDDEHRHEDLFELAL